LQPAQPPAVAAVPELPLTPNWQDLPRWRVLDTSFQTGRHFLQTWLAWRRDAKRPQLLHYVALCQQPPALNELLQACTDDDGLLPLAQSLGAFWFGLLPGFHRFLLADGQVVLTLCVGDARQSLRQQQFFADEAVVWPGDSGLPGAFDLHDLWAVKALARCCKRGTLLHGPALAQPERAAELFNQLRVCGFIGSQDALAPADPTSADWQARYDPPWTLKTTRQTHATTLPIQRCAVIGAGLAGASVAAALARRGWQVQVLDAAAAPATGASGLPVGLVVPHTSSDDCQLSRLSRAGVRLTLQQARQHLQHGVQWSSSGVLERQIGGTPQLPAHWPPEGQDWSEQRTGFVSGTGQDKPEPALWHPHAAWVKPAELVRAWLRQPGVTFQGDAEVSYLQRDGDIWHVHSPDGRLLCSAERVVFANACAARPLLEALASRDEELARQLPRLPATQGMRGLLSWALHGESTVAAAAFPAHPVNGLGSLVPHIPTTQGSAWFMGSSYQPAHHFERADSDNHDHNFEHLQQLLPELAASLAATFASTGLNTWKGTRCVTVDRLPLVGPLDEGCNPSLWFCAGLGSRGLSFSVLCAELLAARMGAEPLPVEANLAKALNALRD